MGIREKAPAKVNLHLGVHLERDERGYHRVETLMAAVDVCDVVEVEEADATSVSCAPDPGVDQQRNTAFRAWEELSRRVEGIPPVAIRISKRIPSEAGLGGGSSDAGAVLRALCQMAGIDVADERVLAAASAVGADVPFFLDPRPTLLAGAGDIPVQKLERTGELWVVLARADGPGVSTPEAYACFDRAPIEPADPNGICEALESGDAHAAGRLLFNNLEHVACALSPQVMDVLEELRSCEGALGATVCGSGSCCFALCETRGTAERCMDRVATRNPDWWVRAARMWRIEDVDAMRPLI